MSTLIHLIYIHGFQGDDTTFQAFPKHLQERISTWMPPRPGITFQSSIYPTYKCVKPLSYATKDFLEWLSTQPPGPVILLAHSMGGLLAAEAATDLSNNPDQHPGAKPKRIVGVIAFDTPYLGLHPHVVITGIASLLPKGGEENGKNKKQETTKAMNDHPQVKFVDDKVTDDWEEFKKQSNIHIRSPVPPSPQPQSSPSSWSFPRSSPVIQGALNLLSGYSDRSLVRWLNKHSDDPFSAGKRWIVERYQFGMAMFDPPGLSARYKHLTQWEGGKWVNYWTETVPKARLEVTAGQLGDQPSGDPSESRRSSSEWMDNDSALVVNGMVSPSEGKAGDLPEVEQKGKYSPKQSKKEENGDKKSSKPKKGHHFTLLPKGLGDRFGGLERWERVEIHGVEDEVGAHLELFTPGRHLGYENLIERVGRKIFEWCEDLLPPQA